MIPQRRISPGYKKGFAACNAQTANPVSLSVDNDSADFCGFLAVVGDCVAGTHGADHHIAGAEGALYTVVVINDFALHQIEQLAVCLMYMIADAAAGLQGDIGEQTAFVVQLVGGGKAGEFYADFDFEMSLINKSAGVTFRASAIFNIISKDGFAFPDSIPPIVPVPQSQIIESCV